jgi:hypothetical protein
MLGKHTYTPTPNLDMELIFNTVDPPLSPRLLPLNHLPIQARRLHGHFPLQ